MVVDEEAEPEVSNMLLVGGDDVDDKTDGSEELVLVPDRDDAVFVVRTLVGVMGLDVDALEKVEVLPDAVDWLVTPLVIPTLLLDALLTEFELDVSVLREVVKEEVGVMTLREVEAEPIAGEIEVPSDDDLVTTDVDVNGVDLIVAVVLGVVDLEGRLFGLEILELDVDTFDEVVVGNGEDCSEFSGFDDVDVYEERLDGENSLDVVEPVKIDILFDVEMLGLEEMEVVAGELEDESETVPDPVLGSGLDELTELWGVDRDLDGEIVVFVLDKKDRGVDLIGELLNDTEVLNDM